MLSAEPYLFSSIKNATGKTVDVGRRRTGPVLQTPGKRHLRTATYTRKFGKQQHHLPGTAIYLTGVQLKKLAFRKRYKQNLQVIHTAPQV